MGKDCPVKAIAFRNIQIGSSLELILQVIPFAQQRLQKPVLQFYPFGNQPNHKYYYCNIKISRNWYDYIKEKGDNRELISLEIFPRANKKASMGK